MKCGLFSVTIFCVIIFNFWTSNAINETSRRKRHLIYPNGGTFKLVVGIGIPVMLGMKQSMAVGWNFQFQYPTPSNATQLLTYPPIVGKSREKREKQYGDRVLFYKAVESLLDREGLPGKACLLHGICEYASLNALHDANGPYGDILHVMLTPDYGMNSGSPEELDYFDAVAAGRYGVDCGSLYGQCRETGGLLDLISVPSEIDRWVIDSVL